MVPTDEDSMSVQAVFPGGEPGKDLVPDRPLSDLLKETGMEDPEQVSTQTDFVMNMQEQYEEEDENEEYELDSGYESDEEEDLRDDDDCIG